jgi:hypothetical protein
MFASAEDGVLVDTISHILLTYCYSVVYAIINRNATLKTSTCHHFLFIGPNPSTQLLSSCDLSPSWPSEYTKNTVRSSLDQSQCLSEQYGPSYRILPCITLQSAILYTGMLTVTNFDSYMLFGFVVIRLEDRERNTVWGRRDEITKGLHPNHLHNFFITEIFIF